MKLPGKQIMKLHKTILALGLSMPFIFSGCSKQQGNDTDHFTDVRQVQKITCVNNLKQIGLDFRIWAGDHGDKFPFQISTNGGGTLELCDRDADGFDRNSIAHFLAASNELSTPLLLCCPKDRSKTAAKDWDKVSAANVTYRLRTDFRVSLSNPHEILAVCPVDGNILYCDGTVTTNGGKHEEHEEMTKPVIFEAMEKELTNQGSR